MPTRAWTLRLAALLAGGSFAVHQLRFLIAGDAHAARAGHGYLIVAGPLVAAGVMLAAAHFAAALARGREVGALPSVTRLWALSSVALAGVYCLQELAEGAVSAGHASGFAGVFGGGGWVALPLAVAVGLVIALLMRGAAAVVALVAGRRRIRHARARAASPRTPVGTPAASFVLLCPAGPRGPPLPSR